MILPGSLCQPDWCIFILTAAVLWKLAQQRYCQCLLSAARLWNYLTGDSVKSCNGLKGIVILPPKAHSVNTVKMWNLILVLVQDLYNQVYLRSCNTIAVDEWPSSFITKSLPDPLDWAVILNISYNKMAHSSKRHQGSRSFDWDRLIELQRIT